MRPRGHPRATFRRSTISRHDGPHPMERTLMMTIHRLAIIAMSLVLLATGYGVTGDFMEKSGLPKAREGTLLRTVQNRGKLIVGTQFDVPTFGYCNPATNQLEGFDVDLARGVAEHI